MKKYFVYTALVALVTASLMAPAAFAQGEAQLATTITIDDDGAAIATTPSAQATNTLRSFNINRDGDYFYALDGYDTMAGLSNVTELERQLDQYNTRVKSLEDSIEASKKSGDTSKRVAFEQELVRSKAAREQIAKSLALAKRMTSLSKLVDVKFDNATVKQAAEALSKASGVTIRADDSIPDSTRLTVEARKIRLSNVLESIARQSNLILEPINLEGKGDLGVQITSLPVLRVNNEVKTFRRSPSPWSDAWGTSPTRQFIFSTPAIGGMGFSGTGKSAEVYGAYAKAFEGLATAGVRGTMNALNGMTTRNGETRLSLAGGTTLTIAKDGTITMIEPGKNDKGEDGFWTTIYLAKPGGITQDKKTWSKTK